MLASCTVGPAHPRKKIISKIELMVLNHVGRWGSWFFRWPDLEVPNGSLNVLTDRLYDQMSFGTELLPSEWKDIA